MNVLKSFVILGLCVGLCAGCSGPKLDDLMGEAPKKTDTGPPPKVAAPLPDPAKELIAAMQVAERAIATRNPEELSRVDKLLYEKASPVDPNHPKVEESKRLRRRVKRLLVPAYMDMAEKSFKRGYYDDAFRQAAYVTDSADKELVKRRKRLMAKKAGIERKRALCAKKWTLRACKLHEKHSDWPLKTCKALFEEKVGLGMTPEMVRVSWGEPKRTERSVNEKTKAVQVVWFFDKGATVVFDGPNDDDLELTEVQN